MLQRRLIVTAITLLLTLAAGTLRADETERTELTAMLHAFLAGASRGDISAHERFWADGLIYTSSNGTRTNKREIIDGMRASQDERPAEPAVIYSADDIDIRLHDDTAIVAFRLVATPNVDPTQPVMNYFNTGTFLKRNGEWRAVAWQATIIPSQPR